MIIQYFNWLAVGAAALAYFFLGAIWFNPKVFGTMWMRGHGLQNPTEEDKKKIPMLMISTLVLCFIGSVTTGYFTYALNSWDWMRGAKIGAIAGIGFTGVGIAMNYMYTKKPFSIILIDSLYHVLGMSIAGIILSVWR